MDLYHFFARVVTDRQCCFPLYLSKAPIVYYLENKIGATFNMKLTWIPTSEFWIPSLVTVLMESKVSVLGLMVISSMSVTKGKAQWTPGWEICSQKQKKHN